MKEDHIIRQLGTLRSIEPNADYATGSKLSLIYQSSQKPKGVFTISESLSASLSMGLVIIFFMFATLSGVSNILKNPLSPAFEGVNGSLAAEANAVNDTIDLRLEEVQYLTEVTTGTLAKIDWKAEGEEGSTDEEIDSLLSEAINL